MEEHQGPIIVVVLVAVVVALGVAVYFSGEGGAKSSGLDSQKRFVAKPGTRREKALALTSSKRDLSATPTGGGGSIFGPGGGETAAQEQGVAPEDRIAVRSLSAPEESEDLTEEDREIRSALNSLDPERGLEKLKELTEGTVERDTAAKAYMAMGLLYAQMDPPDYAASDSAFSTALDEAPTRNLRQQIVQSHASMLLLRGANARAKEAITNILAEVGPANVIEGRLRVMLGQVFEAEGDTAEAETQYRNALQQVSTLPTADAEEQSDVLRLAGLQLSRLYHKTGRSDDARNIVQQLETSLPRESSAASASGP